MSTPQTDPDDAAARGEWADYAVLVVDDEIGMCNFLSRALGARIRIEDRGGRIRPAGLHFGNRERALEKFVRRVARPWQSAAKPRAMVSHCDAAADAERCLQLLRQQLPNLAAAWISETGPAVGAHAGPGTVVIALQDWRAPS